MRRHISVRLLLAFVMLVMGVGVALAQYRGYSNGDPFAAPQQHVASGQVIAERVLIQVVTALVGFVIGAFFSPKLRRLRRFLLVLLVIGGLAFAAFGPEPFADWMAGIVALFVFLVALAIGLSLGRKALARQEEPPPTSFGTAKWATEAYLQERGLFEDKGFFLGEFIENGRRNRPSPSRHRTGCRTSYALRIRPSLAGQFAPQEPLSFQLHPSFQIRLLSPHIFGKSWYQIATN